MTRDDEAQLSKFTAIFAAGTMISRVLGLVRDAMINSMIAVGPREAFLVAFRLPNTLRDIVGEGAANAAFVPVFSETLERKPREEFRAVVSTAFGAMIVLLAAISVAGMGFVPWMLSGLNALDSITGGRRHSPEELARLVEVGRWTFPYIFFIGLAVFSMAVSFTVHHYSTPSWAPALLNVAMIGSCLTFRWFDDPVWSLVIGVWLGGIAQVAAQYYAMGRHSGVWMPSFRLNRTEIYTILGLMGPVVVGQAAGEVNKLVDTLFAYNSAAGSVTALYTANRLVQLPLSVFGFATAAAVLPAAARAAARHRPDQLRALIIRGLRQIFFTITPAMLGLIILARPITRLLFEYRHFTSEDTERTAIALIIYSAGLLAFSWVKVLVTGFYAVKDTRTPAIIASGSMVLNIALCALLVRPYGYKGLAVATSFSYCVNFLVLYILLWQRLGRLWDRPFSSSLIRMSMATALMSTLAYVAYVRLFAYFPADTVAARLVLVSVPITIAVIAYAAFSRFFGVEELDGFLRVLKRIRSKG